jgi:Ca2+-binding EF-hand superfamily protein
MPISEKEADDLFKLCDTNGDGIVTKLELLKGLNAYFQKTMSVEDVSVSWNISLI